MAREGISPRRSMTPANRTLPPRIRGASRGIPQALVGYGDHPNQHGMTPAKREQIPTSGQMPNKLANGPPRPLRRSTLARARCSPNARGMTADIGRIGVRGSKRRGLGAPPGQCEVAASPRAPGRWRAPELTLQTMARGDGAVAEAAVGSEPQRIAPQSQIAFRPVRPAFSGMVGGPPGGPPVALTGPPARLEIEDGAVTAVLAGAAASRGAGAAPTSSRMTGTRWKDADPPNAAAMMAKEFGLPSGPGLHV